MDLEHVSPEGLDDTRRNRIGDAEDDSEDESPIQSLLHNCLTCGRDELCSGGIQVSEGHFWEECRTAPQNAEIC